MRLYAVGGVWYWQTGNKAAVLRAPDTTAAIRNDMEMHENIRHSAAYIQAEGGHFESWVVNLKVYDSLSEVDNNLM